MIVHGRADAADLAIPRRPLLNILSEGTQLRPDAVGQAGLDHHAFRLARLRLEAVRVIVGDDPGRLDGSRLPPKADIIMRVALTQSEVRRSEVAGYFGVKERMARNFTSALLDKGALPPMDRVLH